MLNQCQVIFMFLLRYHKGKISFSLKEKGKLLAQSLMTSDERLDDIQPKGKKMKRLLKISLLGTFNLKLQLFLYDFKF
ncbi:CLUMA_CG015973, isoform A [Clunio marinus]|uniref:CLUMA_CG015973, isoform A n=1 Tax=Clunio marinus TaxID=568069 RepID=A0A1J1ISN4_9DIPT|nr:CLUMA_CG015973, isoform A [Clunio marinus]